MLNASNGSYLSKALVAIDGTNVSTLTNDFGEYTLRNVPVGTANLTFTYTGLTPKTESVEVSSTAAVTLDVTLGSGNARPDGTYMLDAFVVETQRYKNATDIAINEERRSVNIKSVVSADAFGDIPSGNVGEFLKYLPGVELEYGGTYIAPTDAYGISVRGFGAADTNIFIDGVPLASASQASLTDQVGLDMLSINNASRIELIKVPTPDMPMDSIGGQVNLISKSAFEFAQPQFTWSAYVTINSEYPNPFEKIPGPNAEKTFAGEPGFTLSYVKPVNDKFGVSLTASSFSQFSVHQRFRPEFTAANVTNQTTNVDLRPFGGANGVTLTNAQGQVSLANPFMNRISITDAPRTSRNYSASMKADWKPFDGVTLTGSYQISTYESVEASRRMQFRIQRPMSWDATSTISYPFLNAAQSANGVAFNPNSTLDMTIDSRDKEGITHTAYLKGGYKKGPWDIFALASISTSTATFKDRENGHFSTIDVTSSIGQIRFENIRDGIPGSVRVFDRNGQQFDWTNLSNWTVPTLVARSGKSDSMDDVINYKLDVRRELDFLPWDFAKLAFKAGFLREEDIKKKWGLGTNYRETYIGPTLPVSDYVETNYVGISPGYGFPAQQWVSTYRLYDIYKQNPANFTVTEANAIENWNSMVGQNKSLKETKDSWYAMVEGSALDSRLNFVAGIRDEDTIRRGRGQFADSKWNFVQNTDGTLYRNIALIGGNGLVRLDQAASPLFATSAQGTSLRADLAAKGINFPTSAVLPGTLAAAMRQRVLNRSLDGESKGDPNYSINVAYDITKNLVGKVAYSRTNGRIPIEDGTVGILTGGNSFSINEAETIGTIPAGVITVANPNLLPEISDNWDFNLTYYTERGGKIGAGYYFKNIENFSDTLITTSADPTFNTVLESLGLEAADFQNWELRTAQNGIGTGKVYGYEFEVVQDLRVLPWLGDWGRRINCFATYTHSKRSETNTTRISARPAATDLATGGINIAMDRMSFNVRASWRDLTYIQGNGNFTVPGIALPVQLATYEPSGMKVDASFNWQFAKKYAFYVSGRNIFENGLRRDRMDLAGVYPAYAHWDDLREFGVQVTFGIKGTF